MSTRSYISIDDVYTLARLARIQVNSQQAEHLQQELSAILAFVEQLNKVDTGGQEPTYQVTGLMNVMRPDEVIDYNVSPEALLQNAPAQEEGSLKVKRVL